MLGLVVLGLVVVLVVVLDSVSWVKLDELSVAHGSVLCIGALVERRCVVTRRVWRSIVPDVVSGAVPCWISAPPRAPPPLGAAVPVPVALGVYVSLVVALGAAALGAVSLGTVALGAVVLGACVSGSGVDVVVVVGCVVVSTSVSVAGRHPKTAVVSPTANNAERVNDMSLLL